jgi:hypothetical protein
MEIEWTYFFIAAFVTFIILYLTYPGPQIIVKMPNPNKEISDLYVDDNNVCYRYHRNEIGVVKSEKNNI